MTVFYNATSVATIPTRWVNPTQQQLEDGWAAPDGMVITGLWYRGNDQNVVAEVRELNPLLAEADREIFEVPVSREALTPVLGEWLRYDEVTLSSTVFVALARA